MRPAAAALLAATCAAASAPDFAAQRRRMAAEIEARGIKDRAVLAALAEVPREEFVPAQLRAHAYDDGPLPIGDGQTISQPYLVALMTELLSVRARSRVLEIGTGSGYQAAILSAMKCEVFSIEIVPALAISARERLRRLGYAVQVREGDGYAGWREFAPFDAIVVTAAPPAIPPALKEQLAIGGKLVIPVGAINGELQVITRTRDGFERRSVAPVAFVPMTGEAQRQRKQRITRRRARGRPPARPRSPPPSS